MAFSQMLCLDGSKLLSLTPLLALAAGCVALVTTTGPWWRCRQEQYLAERARRDAERAARMAELAGEPFDKEITMCEQVLNYLAKFVSVGASAAQEKKVRRGFRRDGSLQKELVSWFGGGRAQVQGL